VNVDDLGDVLAVLSDVVPTVEIATCDPLDTLAELGVDSLSLIAFVAALEKRFSVRFADGDLESLGTATLRDVQQLVVRVTRSAADSNGVEHATGREERPGGIVVRGYRDADREALRRICIEESNLGPLRDLAPLFFLDQYCDDDPASCFVAELDGRIVGYWVGTLDARKLERGFRAHLMRHLGGILRWYRSRRAAMSTAERRAFWRQVVGEGHRIRRRTAFMIGQVGEIFGRTYVHFQLDRESAPPGAVFSLARTWLEHLRRRGLGGALLPSIPGGPSALELWKRLGFAPLPITRVDGTTDTWLLAVL
jgi:acyl carrier protein